MRVNEGDILQSRTSNEVALVLEVYTQNWGTETKLLRFGDDGPFVASYGDGWGLESEWQPTDE